MDAEAGDSWDFHRRGPRGRGDPHEDEQIILQPFPLVAYSSSDTKSCPGRGALPLVRSGTGPANPGEEPGHGRLAPARQR